MNDSRLPSSIQKLIDGDRGVSPVIAVALLILIAVGFAVAIQGVGSDLIGSVEQPPEASIDANPQADQVRLTVRNAQNVDQLELNHNGSTIDSSDGALSPEAGNSTVLTYSDLGASVGDQISVVAVDFPDNRQVVYTYTIPEGSTT